MKKFSILVIDDEEIIRGLLSEYLGRLGHTITTAIDVIEGLKSFQENPTDIVLTDMKMPGNLDGIDIVRRIKAFKPETRFIVLTAFANDLERIENITDEIFTKPIDLNKLKELIDTF